MQLYRLNPIFMVRKEYFGGVLFNSEKPRWESHLFLNEITTDILRLCEDGTSKDILLKILSKKYPGLKNHLNKTLGAFLEYCSTRKIIKKVDDECPTYEQVKNKFSDFNEGAFERLSAPIIININPTFRCNQRCEFCYVQNSCKARFAKELDIHFWKGVIDQIVENKIPFIDILGGEPFLFNGLMDLLEYINQKPINCVISSNGTLITDSMLSRLSKLDQRKFHINISLEEGTPRHDSVVHLKGAFQKIEEFITKALSKHINFSINTVVTKRNHNELDKIYQFSYERGVEKQSFTYFNACSNEMKELTNEISFNDFYNATEKIYSINKKKLKPISIVRQGFFLWFFDTYEIPINPYINSFICCELGASRLDITPNGDVYPCSLLFGDDDCCIGSLSEKSIKEIWNGKKMNYFRKLKRNIVNRDINCKKCNFKEACKGGCFGYTKNRGFDVNAPDSRCPIIQKHLS